MNLKINLPIYSYLILFPIALLFLNESWAYNPFGWVDHWSYYGLSYYYPRSQQIFSQLPISELIPVTTINIVLFNLFDVIGARLLRASILLTIGMGFVFYISNIITRSKFRSYLSSVAFATYLYTLSAAGSDYTEVYIQLELLFSVLCILGFYKEQEIIKENFWLISFGFSIALLMLTAILSIVYIFVLILFYLSLISAKYKSFGIYRFILNPLSGLLFGIWFFGMCLYKLNGSIPLINNIKKLFNFLGGAYQAPEYSLWINEASWLIFPSAIILSSLICILFNIDKIKLIFGIKYNGIGCLEKKYLLFIISIYFLLVFINIIIKQWSLQFLYFGQTTPLYFIAMSILIFNLENYSKRIKTIICIAFTILAISGYYYSSLAEHNFLEVINLLHNNYLSPIVISLVILFLISILSFKFDHFACIYLAIFVFFNIYSFSPTFGCFTCADGAFKYINRPIYMNSNRKILNLSVYLSRLLDVSDYSRKSMIWFSDDNNLGAITRQSFAMNYLNNERSLINKEYPLLTNFTGPIGSSGTRPVVGNRILGIIFNTSDCESGLISLKKNGFKINKFDQKAYIYNDELLIKICEFSI